MTEHTSSPFLSEEWMQSQRAYWDAWASLSRLNTKAGPNANPMANNPWSQALENWWKAISGSINADGQEFFGRLIGQGKSFFQFGQEMSQFLNSLTETAKVGGQWKEALRARFDEMKAVCAKAQTGEVPAALKGMLAFCELPLDTWRRTMSGTAAVPGDFLQSVRSDVWEHIGEKMHEGVDKFLSVPGVGYTREGQEQMQTLARLVLDYQRAMQDYTAAHGKLGTDTLDRLYKKIIEVSDKGGAITSMRQVYDLWVDCGEEAYAEFVMSAQFAGVYGRLVNALMAVKHQLRSMVDENLAALNMPTRREMNTILRRQQELNRTLKALQREQSGDDGPRPRRGARKNESTAAGEARELRREIAALREELSGLREQGKTAAADDTGTTGGGNAPERGPASWDIGSISPAVAKSTAIKRRRATTSKR